MNIEAILTGSLIGIILQQLVMLYKEGLSFRRDKSKMFYQNKLTQGQSLLSLYVGIYFQVRSIINVFETLSQMLDDPDLDIDHDACIHTLETAWAKLLVVENQLLDVGSQAFLYYDIDSGWNDADFTSLYQLSIALGPKIQSFNQLAEEYPESEEYAEVQADVKSDVTAATNSFKQYFIAIDAAIKQIKSQAKS